MSDTVEALGLPASPTLRDSLFFIVEGVLGGLVGGGPAYFVTLAHLYRLWLTILYRNLVSRSATFRKKKKG